jgi:hypothetical protein
MPNKLTFEYVQEFINKDELLISKEYINNKSLLQIQCNICKENYNQNFDRYKRGHRHQKCTHNKIINSKTMCSINGTTSARKRYGDVFIKDTIRICIWCKKEYNPKRSEQKLCSQKCSHSFINKDKEINFLRSQKGGTISSEKQQRRSKNEIVCADLCIGYFGENDILCNERIFKDKNENMWDADIVIKSLKIAILWDGNWHRKKCNKKHNLEHVQLRDKWKREIILDNGYTYYTINDFGGFNKEFVQEQFNLFIHKLHFKNCLENLNTNKVIDANYVTQ